MIQPPDLIQLAKTAHDERLLRHAAAALASPTPPPPAGSDMSDYLALHEMIRRVTAALRAATAADRTLDERSASALAAYWEGYAAELHARHTVEDTIFFPALVERDPAIAVEIARIDTDHAELDELIALGDEAFASLEAGVAATAAHDVLVRLERLMVAHLDFEDAELLPRIGRLFDQAEYDAMHDRAVRASSSSVRQVAFLVPFIATWIDPAAWQRLWDKAPLPLRVAYRLTRRRHGRLTEAAFGSVLSDAAE